MCGGKVTLDFSNFWYIIPLSNPTGGFKCQKAKRDTDAHVTRGSLKGGNGEVSPRCFPGKREVPLQKHPATSAPGNGST